MRLAPGSLAFVAGQLSAWRRCARNVQRSPQGARDKGSNIVANKDLRDWIDGIKAAGELKVIKLQEIV